MTKEEFINEAYRRADNAGRIDDELVIRFYLDMFLKMGMAPPEMEGKYVDGRVQKRGWETEE